MTLEEALKEAHEATCENPDYAIWPRCIGSRNVCEEAHAAIDLVAKVAALEQAEKMIEAWDGSFNSIAAERDRLRREVEEAEHG